ncbi:hypothetical protein [Saccharothrix sp. HUAS TT1]|uniref:hypothetical protein n=1 Tax=unclassified Saccharothrix TaxID=2593673 RepID=UPI00345B557D
MSYRSLPGTLAAIEAALAHPVLCARRGCTELVFTWLSPWCTPGCARRAADTARTGAPDPVELTAEEQALRARLADLARLCRTQLADVREADELVPETLDEQDRAAIAHVATALAQVPAKVARLKAAHRDRLAALAHARFNAPPMTAEEAADLLGLPLPSRPERQGLDALRYAVDAVRRAADDPMLTGRWEDAPATPPVTVELHGSTPEDRERAAEALAEIAQEAAEQPADVDQTAFALQPSSTELAAIEEQIADHELAIDRALHEIEANDALIAELRPRGGDTAGLLAKPRPRPRPPWWRRLARALSTRKARP